MSVPEKISGFLLARVSRAYCDGCIQERLGLKWRQQVQLVTSTLAVTPSFRRETGLCCHCQEQKQVVRAVAEPTRRLPRRHDLRRGEDQPRKRAEEDAGRLDVAEPRPVPAAAVLLQDLIGFRRPGKPGLRCLESMIPKSGHRFSDKIMLK